MTAPDWVLDIDQKRGNKLVLLVEGVDDRAVFDKMLSRIDPRYTMHIQIFSANNRKKVLAGLSHRGNANGWWGIIDRDESDDAKVATLHAENPTLRVLPRYCLESYFIDPDEIWLMIPEPKRTHFARGLDDLKAIINPEIPKWVCHWAMWCVIHKRRFDLLTTLRFPDQLLDQMTHGILSEVEIHRELLKWYNHFEPAPIYREYDHEKCSADGKVLTDRYRKHIHGKHFFEQIVSAQGLCRIQTKSAGEWLRDLSEAFARVQGPAVDVPSDLQPMLNDIMTAARAWTGRVGP